MIPEQIKSHLVNELGDDFRIDSSRMLGGGSINRAARMDTAGGSYFIKWNSARLYPQMFELEARSLNILRAALPLHIPAPVYHGEAGDDAFLLLEYVEQGTSATDFWESFAEGLAEQHRQTASVYGLDFDNYIGSLAQSNRKHGSWIDFFVEERLQPQLRLARNNGLADKALTVKFEHMFYQLDKVFPEEEKPALLHGDLWSGNFMTDSHGQACIFDPAIYYGNRIMDIGMSKMFGGFSSEFYELYNRTFPMENNWQEQVDVANLYPYLVHVNLFGRGYLNGIIPVLKRFA